MVHFRQGYSGQVGEPGHVACRGPHLAPGEPAAERESYGEMVLVNQLRETIRWLNSAIPSRSRALAIMRDTPLPKLLSRALSMAGVEKEIAQDSPKH